MLGIHEVYKRIGPVNLTPILSVLDQLPFVDICVGSIDPRHPYCAVVVPGTKLPDAVSHFVQSLGLGGTPHRYFFRKLYPGWGIRPHTDDWIPAEAHIRRFQVPLVSHPDILMRWPTDGIEVYLEPGWFYEVRYDRLHEVVNPTQSERIHLQVDQVDATIE
mgnify:CR=1 FL=1